MEDIRDLLDIPESDLADHQRHKKSFVSPWNKRMGEKAVLMNWFEDSLPEFLWWHAITDLYGHFPGGKRGQRVTDILRSYLREDKKSTVLGFCSDFSRIRDEDRREAREDLIVEMGTLIDDFALETLLFERHPMRWIFEGGDYYADEGPEAYLERQVLELANRRGEPATRVKHLALGELLREGKLVLQKGSEMVEVMRSYPKVENHDKAAAILGATYKGVIMSSHPPDTDWVKEFWSSNRRRTDCRYRAIEDSEEVVERLTSTAIGFSDSPDISEKVLSFRPRIRSLSGTARTNGIDKDLSEVVLGLASRAIRIVEDLAINVPIRSGIWLHAGIRMIQG